MYNSPLQTYRTRRIQCTHVPLIPFLAEIHQYPQKNPKISLFTPS
nr:MAG TPA: hypothetical protein [Caudoviricetes sp.]